MLQDDRSGSYGVRVSAQRLSRRLQGMFNKSLSQNSAQSRPAQNDLGPQLRHMHEDLVSRLHMLQNQLERCMDAQSTMAAEQNNMAAEQVQMSKVLTSIKVDCVSSTQTSHHVSRYATRISEDDEKDFEDLIVRRERTGNSVRQKDVVSLDHAASILRARKRPSILATREKDEDSPTSGVDSASLRLSTSNRFSIRRSRPSGIESHVVKQSTCLSPRGANIDRSSTGKSYQSSRKSGVTFDDTSDELSHDVSRNVSHSSTDITTITRMLDRDVDPRPSTSSPRISVAAGPSPTSWYKRNARSFDLGTLKGSQPVYDRIAKREGFELKKLTPSKTRRFDLQRLDHSEIIEVPKWLVAFHPDKPFRTSLDTLALMMLLHDAVVVPYLIGWNVEEDGYVAGTWITRIFWTIDLPISLMTGYRTTDQMLEIRLIPSMKYYIRTWFFPDLFLVIFDWVGYLMKGSRIFRVARVRSSFRAFRLIRAFSKMPRAADIWARLVLASDKKEILVILSIARVIFVILWINHLVACGWYALAKFATPDTGSTWLDKDVVYISSPLYEYSTSLHWAITQMTPGSMEVVPMNSSERLFTVVILFLGLVIGSTLVAILSSILTQYRLQLEAKSNKFMQLQLFLTQQKIDPLLSMAIKRNVTMRVAKKTRLKKKEVVYLQEIPLEMQKELNHGVYLNVINHHMFFASVNELDHGDAMRDLCNSAFVLQDLQAGDFLFEEDEEGDKMYFVVEGSLQYLPGPQSAEGAFPRANDHLMLQRGDWCSEPALWTIWTYLGSLYVSSMSEVLWVRAAEMQKELAAYPHTMDVVSAYCTAFHNHMNERGVLHSDLPFRTDYLDIIFSMSQRERISLAAPALDKVKHEGVSAFFKKREHDRLEKEIMEGKCHISNLAGELERTVYVIALRLCLPEESRFLVKLGEMHGGTNEFKAMCILPGTKKKPGEVLVDSLQRLLETDLQALGRDIEVYIDSGCEQTSTVKESPTYGIKTRYIRSVVHGIFKGISSLACMDVPASARKAAERAHSIMDFTLSHADYERRQKAMQVLTSIDEVYFMTVPRHQGNSHGRHSMDYTATASQSMDSLDFSDVDYHGMFVLLNSSQFEVISAPPADFVLRRWIAEFNNLDKSKFWAPKRFSDQIRRHSRNSAEDGRTHICDLFPDTSAQRSSRDASEYPVLNSDEIVGSGVPKTSTTVSAHGMNMELPPTGFDPLKASL